MGLINGSVTYRRFRVTDTVTKDFREQLTGGMKRYAFRDINPKTNPEMSIGWVNSMDPIDTELTVEKVIFGRHVILGIRRDRKSIPAALLKARVSEAVRATLRERRAKKLSREETVALRETVREAMLAAVSPTTTLFEAVWNYETGDVFLSTQAQKAATEFAELFEATTGLGLSETTLVSRAEAFIESTGMNVELATLDESAFGR